MQFREQGNRIQVLAYQGYDKIKKRAVIKLVGSFNKHTLEMSDGLVDNLTDDEKNELQSHMEIIRQSNEKNSRLHAIDAIAQYVKKVADSLTDDECASRITEQSASEIYEAIDTLTKTLRKLGHKRPKPTAPAE